MPGEGRAGRALSRRRGVSLFLGSALAVVALDVATKLAVYHGLDPRKPPVRILGDMVRLTYIHNAGSAFGLFQGGRWFFVAVSAVSAGLITLLALSGRHHDRGMQCAFGLILGGAVGNLIDRLWLGVVIDFIQIGIRSHYWPVFNVADIGVTVGVGLLALRLLVPGKSDDRSALLEASGTGDAEPGGRAGAAP